MTYRYTPILRWKRGERVGMRRVSATGRVDVAPMFVIAPEQYRDGTGGNAAAIIAQELHSMWSSSPIYVDASSLSVGPSGVHPITAISAEARAKGVTFVPATVLNASPAYQAAVAAIVASDQRGVALRVDLHQLTSASAWAGSWGYSFSETDLIADFADNVGNVIALGASIIHAFQSLHGSGNWRTVTVAGTSMPDNFTGYTSGPHTIPRRTIDLWSSLNSSGLSYRVDFGDYATVPINAPAQGIAWGFPINARYSLDREFLIARGVGTTGINGVDMDQQLRSHAQLIRGFPSRNALAHCWADGEIDQIAAGAKSPGNLETWVQLAVNRHIEITRTFLP